MNPYDISLRRNKVDYLLSITAMLQPVLTLIQLYMINAMHVEPDVANRFRIISTAVPIVIALVFVMMRKPILTAFTYLLVLIILLLTVIVFPDRWTFMSDDVMKFTLPVVIPTGLCLASIRNFAVLVRCMMMVSLSAAFIGMLYAVSYLSGNFLIEEYSMAFSYALLFPTYILISKDSIVWKIIAIFLMIEMLAIGSRGAFLLSVAYWVFMVIWGRNMSRKTIYFSCIILLIIVFFYTPVIDALSDLFNTIGVRSRTLRLLTEDELLTHDSGRNELRGKVWEYINIRPLLGNGVWADRQFLGTYSHNVILELLLDFGFLGTAVVLGILLVKQLRIFHMIPTNHKKMYIMMFGLLLPLFVSSSYLTSFNAGMFLGFTYLQSNIIRRKQYLNYQFK